MRHDDVGHARRAGVLAALAALLLVGCAPPAGPTAPPPVPTPSRTAPDEPVFAAATAALTSDLVPSADVRTCADPQPGATGSREDPDRAAGQGDATDPATPAPTSAPCGMETVEAVRAASLVGSSHAPGEPIVLPVAGGATRVVEVYELADAQAAAATYAARVGDEEGWAVDQEIPAADLENGSYTPRRVITGARLEAADVPGWSATVLSRDEEGFTRAGASVSAPVSYAYLWAVRDTLLLRVLVAADAPGGAAASAADVARRYATAFESARASRGR